MRILLAMDDTEGSMEAIARAASWITRREEPYTRLLQAIPAFKSFPDARNDPAPGVRPPGQDVWIGRATRAFDQAKAILVDHGMSPYSIDSVLWFHVTECEFSSRLIKEVQTGCFRRVIFASDAFLRLGQATAPTYLKTVNGLFGPKISKRDVTVTTGPFEASPMVAVDLRKLSSL